jgi:hypothetical protein
MNEVGFDYEVRGDRVMRMCKMGFSPSRGVEASGVEALDIEALDIEASDTEALGTGKLRMALAGPFHLKRTRPAAG